MKTPVTIESLLKRVKLEVAARERKSEAHKLEAREERRRRARPPESTYQRADYWTPIRLHREYQIQHCDCCQGETKVFLRDQVELQHRIDKSARRFINERGETCSPLPITYHLSETVVPQCFDCFTIDRHLTTLFNDQKETSK